MMNSTLPLADDPQTHIQSRIRRIGKIGSTLSTVLLALIGLVIGLVLLAAVFGSVSINPALQITKGSWSYSSSQPVSAAIALAWLVITFAAPVWLMRLLFVQFTLDAIFSLKTARLIKWLGVWNMIGAVALSPMLLLSGLFLIALGWAMELAASLKQEQDLTI
jgi:hypothetical protein